MKGKKIIVYTCNLGHYDDYRNLVVPPNTNIRFIYFTDIPKPVAGWEVIQVDKTIISDQTKLARYYKINPHKVLPEHDYSLWIDARFDFVIENIESFIHEYKKELVSCFEHNRDCDKNGLFIEASVVKEGNIDDVNIINDQISKYKKANFPDDKGLFSTGIILRKNDVRTTKFNDVWWNEVKEFSKRDQLSQMYAAWATGININCLKGGNVYSNRIIKKCYYHRHKKKHQNNQQVLVKKRKLIDKRYKNERPIGRK